MALELFFLFKAGSAFYMWLCRNVPSANLVEMLAKLTQSCSKTDSKLKSTSDQPQMTNNISANIFSSWLHLAATPWDGDHAWLSQWLGRFCRFSNRNRNDKVTRAVALCVTCGNQAKEWLKAVITNELKNLVLMLSISDWSAANDWPRVSRDVQSTW